MPLKLGKDLSREVKRGHPWVYQGALKDPLPAKTGIEDLLDKKGRFLARGIFERESPLAFRVLSFDPKFRLDSHFLEKQISHCQNFRAHFFSNETTGYRLINGEGDGMPGLICDVYGDVAVLQTDGRELDQIWDLPVIAEILIQDNSLSSVIHKPQRNKGAARWIKGATQREQVEFLENGVCWTSDVLQGQKTGFFLDQRNSRNWVRSQSSKKSVLNLFSYSGGFSVSAGVGGATEVVSVDISQSAIERAQVHWDNNKLPTSQHRGVATDVFDFLNEETTQFDVVVVDPPSFAPSQSSVSKAIQSYIHVFSESAKKVKPGGVLALSSCSSHISFEIFYDICIQSVSKARRRARVRTVLGQPEDHPFPLVCPELRYLKFFGLELFDA